MSETVYINCPRCGRKNVPANFDSGYCYECENEVIEEIEEGNQE